jgi:hypothetical protein
MTEQNMTPAQKMMAKISAAVAEFKETQEQEVTYRDINLMLNSAWEILSEVPTVADDSLEERITGLTSELDDICGETLVTADAHEGEGLLLACRDGELIDTTSGILFSQEEVALWHLRNSDVQLYSAIM